MPNVLLDSTIFWVRGCVYIDLEKDIYLTYESVHFSEGVYIVWKFNRTKANLGSLIGTRMKRVVPYIDNIICNSRHSQKFDSFCRKRKILREKM